MKDLTYNAMIAENELRKAREAEERRAGATARLALGINGEVYLVTGYGYERIA